MRERRTGSCRGFTLVEMVVVVALIAGITALALPELMPTLVFSRFDGSARHLAAYGRGAMAHACLLREPISVYFDFEKREYWSERWVDAEERAQEENGQEQESSFFSGGSMFSKFGADDTNDEASDRSSSDSDEDQVYTDTDAVRDRFDRFVRRQLEARAKLVNHEGFLDEIGPLFEKKFTLKDEPEGEWEELFDPVLERSQLAEDVEMVRVFVGSSSFSSGRAEVKLTEVGLEEPVLIHLRSGDEYCTVIWNPLTGGSSVREGRVDPKEAFRS